MDNQILDCIIVGGGPAGLTAGIYLRRFHRSILIVDNGTSRARKIPLSNNYPGFPHGVSGDELLKRLHQQLQRFEGSVTQGTVTSVKILPGQLFGVEFAGRTIVARTVLLATGVVDIEPDIPGYDSVRDLIRFCPVCDGFEHTDLRIGIIGNGWHGVRECEFIRHFSSQLSFLCVDLQPAGIAPICQHLRASNINVITASGGRLYRGGSTNENIYLETEEGETHEFEVMYCALGNRVRSSLLTELGAAHDEQKCLTVDKHLETSVPGLYAAGDVVSSLDQLAVATGQAAIASTAIHNRLREHSGDGRD